MKTNKDKYLEKLQKEMMQFSDKKVGDVQGYLNSCIRSAYSTGAYHTVKEIHEKRFGKDVIKK